MPTGSLIYYLHICGEEIIVVNLKPMTAKDELVKIPCFLLESLTYSKRNALEKEPWHQFITQHRKV